MVCMEQEVHSLLTNGCTIKGNKFRETPGDHNKTLMGNCKEMKIDTKIFKYERGMSLLTWSVYLTLIKLRRCDRERSGDLSQFGVSV